MRKRLECHLRKHSKWKSDAADLPSATNTFTVLSALLETEGVIEQRLSGRIRYFRFANTLKAQAVAKLLKKWDYLMRLWI